MELVRCMLERTESDIVALFSFDEGCEENIWTQERGQRGLLNVVSRCVVYHVMWVIKHACECEGNTGQKGSARVLVDGKPHPTIHCHHLIQ